MGGWNGGRNGFGKRQISSNVKTNTASCVRARRSTFSWDDYVRAGAESQGGKKGRLDNAHECTTETVIATGFVHLLPLGQFDPRKTIEAWARVDANSRVPAVGSLSVSYE